MSKTFTLRSSILAMGLLAASGFAAAADEAPNGPPPGKHAQHRHFDPVAHTQRNLDNLAGKLNLKEEQKAAWQTYADSALSRAKERTAKMEEMHSHKGEARANADTATKLDRMSKVMRERADKLQQIAQDTRTIEAALTPEQKTIFDLYWKSQFHQRMGHRPLT
jgi:Spy/CpxP family protein refolding chaperone